MNSTVGLASPAATSTRRVLDLLLCAQQLQFWPCALRLPYRPSNRRNGTTASVSRRLDRRPVGRSITVFSIARAPETSFSARCAFGARVLEIHLGAQHFELRGHSCRPPIARVVDVGLRRLHVGLNDAQLLDRKQQLVVRANRVQRRHLTRRCTSCSPALRARGGLERLAKLEAEDRLPDVGRCRKGVARKGRSASGTRAETHRNSGCSAGPDRASAWRSCST